MPAGWAALAGAVVAGGASYLGSKKQADASKDAAKISQGQYQNNVTMEQPYIQSGYGAMGKLNTLLGINPDPNSPTMMPNQNVAPAGMTVNGPAQQLTNIPQQQFNSPPQRMQPSSKPSSNPQLRQILQIRADNGDPQAKQMLSMV